MMSVVYILNCVYLSICFFSEPMSTEKKEYYKNIVTEYLARAEVIKKKKNSCMYSFQIVKFCFSLDVTKIGIKPHTLDFWPMIQ